MPIVLLLLAISLYYGWRYSQTEVDPDWSMFNLQAFTGSRYGRDFADCKTPAIHYWYYLLAKIVGADVRRVKFAHHFLLGSVGIILYLTTGNLYASLAYTILINSGWLLAFHGNVGQHPAAFIAIALVAPSPLIAAPMLLLAVLWEPKLLLSIVAFVLIKGWWWTGLAIPPAVAFYLVFRNAEWFKQWWESSVTIPLRMSKARKLADFPYMPWFTANVTLYLLPWLFAAGYSKPDLWYWLPAAMFLMVTLAGKVVRQNHLIPLVAWVAMANISPVVVIALVITDLVSAGGYWKENWERFYGFIAEIHPEVRNVGEWLRDKPGVVWVNSLHSGVYIHARKPVPFGLCEQIEIREAAHERREEMKRRFKENPPDWVVVGNSPGIKFLENGYRKVAQAGETVIYKKQ